jgi:Leucine-rich repeat (LRR) protein
VFINEVVNGKTIIADKLTGELEIKDYPVLTEVELREHEIEKLTIINCPNLEKIICNINKLTELDIARIKTDADGNPVPTDKLKELVIGGNKELKAISLEYCPELERLCVPGNEKLDRILGLSKLSELRSISVDGLPRGLVDLIMAEKGLFPLPRE